MSDFSLSEITLSIHYICRSGFYTVTLLPGASTAQKSKSQTPAPGVKTYQKPAYINPFPRGASEDLSQNNAAKTPQTKIPQNRPAQPSTSTSSGRSLAVSSSSQLSTPKSRIISPVNASPLAPSSPTPHCAPRVAIVPTKATPPLAKRIVEEIADLTDQLRDVRRDLLGKELDQKKMANTLRTVEESLAGITEELSDHIATANAFQKSMAAQMKTLTDLVTKSSATGGEKRKREDDGEEDEVAMGASARRRARLERNPNHSVSIFSGEGTKSRVEDSLACTEDHSRPSPQCHGASRQ